jgi:DNA-binding CsgD family transcriptional regulator
MIYRPTEDEALQRVAVWLKHNRTLRLTPLEERILARARQGWAIGAIALDECLTVSDTDMYLEMAEEKLYYSTL